MTGAGGVDDFVAPLPRSARRNDPADADDAVVAARALQQRIRSFEQIVTFAPDFADTRYDESHNTFTDDGVRANASHIVNTSTSMIVMGRRRRLFRYGERTAYAGPELGKLTQWYTNEWESSDSTEQTRFWRSRDQTSWSPYTTALVIGAVGYNARDAPPAVIGAAASSRFESILTTEIDRLTGFLSAWAVSDQGNFDHPFFAFTAFDSLDAVGSLRDLPVVAQALERVTAAREAALSRFQREFYSQLSFALGSMAQHLDPSGFILSLCILSTYGRGLTELPQDVIDVALERIFALQQPVTGQWDTSRPLLGTEAGRVGCSSLELAIQLLRVILKGPRFERHFANLDRLAGTLEQDFEPAAPLRGWPVDIRRTHSQRQTWYGFYAFEFLDRLMLRTRDYAARVVRDSLRYDPDPKMSWSDVADYRGIKAKLERDVIEPWTEEGRESEAKSSIILFGPPGTGKTTIARALAVKLGWGMIELGPGNFLVNGFEGLFARGDVIFERLLLLDKVVVFFDEIDELVSVRDANSKALSRFLTTYMLPWIQKLRDRHSVVFIFATNHLERFDPAIRRSGRFDLVLPVGPPGAEERERLLSARRPSISEQCLRTLVDEAPERATIGDIVRAIDSVPSSAAQADCRDVIAALGKSSALSIPEDDWHGFLEQLEQVP